MNNLETLEYEIQELQLTKDVMFEEVKLQHQVHDIKQDLRNMGVIFDFQKFLFTAALLLGIACSYICFMASKAFDNFDKFLNWMDNISK